MPLVGGASVASVAALRGMMVVVRMRDDGLDDLMNGMSGFWKVGVRDNAQLFLMVRALRVCIFGVMITDWVQLQIQVTEIP
jgi:hypothetical protein